MYNTNGAICVKKWYSFGYKSDTQLLSTVKFIGSLNWKQMNETEPNRMKKKIEEFTHHVSIKQRIDFNNSNETVKLCVCLWGEKKKCKGKTENITEDTINTHFTVLSKFFLIHAEKHILVLFDAIIFFSSFFLIL